MELETFIVSLNNEFVDLLCELGLIGKVETVIQHTHKRTFSLLVISGIKIAIIGKIENDGYFTKKELKNNCSNLIELGMCDISFGVIFHLNLQSNKNANQEEIRKKLHNSVFTVKFWHPNEIEIDETANWIKTDIKQMQQLIQNSIKSLCRGNFFSSQVGKVSETLDNCITDIKKSEKSDLHNLASKIAELMELRPPENEMEYIQIIKMAYLILIDICIFYNVIQLNEPNLKPFSFNIKKTGNNRSGILYSFSDALKINYGSIIDIAIKIIELLQADYYIDDSIDRIITLSKSISSNRVLLRHDLMGRIYHKLLFDNIAKNLATFYTSVPAASLLARMAINMYNPEWESINWGSKENLTKLKVVDFACGSGTLLTAIAEAIEYRYTVSKKDLDPQDLSSLHNSLISEVIYGFDVQLYAVHMAIISLSLLNPGFIYNKNNFYTLHINKNNLGSLELLKSELVEEIMSESIGSHKSPVKKNEVINLILRNNEFDLIIMNPPFTRSCGDNLMFGQLPKEDQKELSKKLSDKFKSLDLSGIGKAGLAAGFSVLADKYLKKGGRFASVLPKTALQGISWIKLRLLWSNKIKIENWKERSGNYQVEAIILSMEPGSSWFSENTSLSECLLITRKLIALESKKSFSQLKTLIIVLTRKPKTAYESFSITNEIAQLFSQISEGNKYDYLTQTESNYYTLKIADKKVGIAYSLPTSYLADYTNNWGIFFSLSSPILNKITFNLISTNIFAFNDIKYNFSVELPLIPLKSIGTVGADRATRDFIINDKEIKGSIPAFIGKDMSLRVISNIPNKYVIPKFHSKKVKNTIKLAGNVLVPERIRTNTSSILGLFFKEKVISNVWWSLNFKPQTSKDGIVFTSDEVGKIQVVWMNTTPGLFCYLAYRQETWITWISMKKAHLEELPIINISQLKKHQILQLLKLYKTIKDKKFPLFPEQYTSKRDLRIKIDYELFKILKPNQIGFYDLNKLYDYFGKEGVFQKGS
ncbi:MAG: Eco57I restriction-modification methylase domain-containing protein [Candidatus Hodarchaeales archaeon]|jgi:methylase of polypeptide subunit release factors